MPSATDDPLQSQIDEWQKTYDGPAIVEQVNTTLFLPPGHELACDAGGSFLVTAP